MAVGVAVDRYRLVLPVDQVRAGGMAPVHVAPHRRVRIVLVVEVIHAVLEEQAVGVVHPAISGGMVVIGTVLVRRHGRRRVGEADLLPRRLGVDAFEMDIALVHAEIRQVHRHAIVGLFARQGEPDIRHIEGLPSLVEGEDDLVVRLPDRENHIAAGRSAIT